MELSRVALIGTGLIGSSFALAIRAAHPRVEIRGFDGSYDAVKEAQRVKAVDRVSSLPDAVEGADLVVVSTPVGAMEAIFEEIAPLVGERTVVTDTGSTKAQVLAWARRHLDGRAQFVGGHPMAGKTVTGAAAAEAGLFQNRVWCLMPSPVASQAAVALMVELVEAAGATPYFLDPDEHDGLVAAVSHLPYLMAVALINQLAEEPSWREAASLAAGGFAYATHLSDSDPRMFADIARTNREPLVRRLDAFIAALGALRDRVATEDPSLEATFAAARQRHQDWLAGRPQATRETASTMEQLPSSRTLLTGSLLGGLGRERKPRSRE